MKRNIIIFFFILYSMTAWSSELDVKITSLTNIRGNGAMEVCGEVKGQTKTTTLVTIKHTDSSYTTLTDEEGRWCQIIKRWSFNGETDAKARKL